MAPHSQKAVIEEPLPQGDSRAWGLGDSWLQFFFSPRLIALWKWGLGPMVSLPTRTDELLKGPGWGAGPVAVLVDDIGENVSTAFITGHLWGQTEAHQAVWGKD